MKANNKQTQSGITLVLPNQIKQLRKKAGVTQEELAKRTGVGLRFIRDLEQSKPTVRLDKVSQVLALFGYHIEAVSDHARTP